jgi:hypothetical protein
MLKQICEQKINNPMPNSSKLCLFGIKFLLINFINKKIFNNVA